MSSELTDEQIAEILDQSKDWDKGDLGMTDAVRAAIAADRALRPDGWISVADRRPEKWNEVIVWPHPGDYCMTGQLGLAGWAYGEYDRDGAQTVPMRDPTHWMPLPTAPAKPAPAADACPGTPDKP